MIVKNKKTGREYSIKKIDWEKIKKANLQRLYDVIDYNDKIDVLDIGCGYGGSLEWAKGIFSWSSFMGIDKFNSDIERAIKKGFNRENFINADIITYDFSTFPKFRYSIMMHVLEHLKSEQDVENVINKAISVSEEFVFLKHPYFDGDEYLKSLGLKFMWSDWYGHPTHVDKNMLTRILDKTGLEYFIGFVHEIKTSDADPIIPYSCDPDQLGYDKEKHGFKPYIKFDKPIYQEIYAFINVKCNYWDELIKKDVR